MTPLRRIAAALTVLLVPLAVSGGAVAAPQLAPVAAPREAAAAVSTGDLSWQLTPTGTTTRLRGLSVVSRDVVWAGGYGGTVLRTTDGGAHWGSVGPAGAQDLQFRDVEATSAQHAVAMSAGEGTDSRLYVTDDGGITWALAFQNEAPSGFFDCMAFSTPQRGLVVSDPVDGAFRFLETSDGGHTWSIVDPAGTPPSRANEFAFAASGSCLSAGQGQATYLGSGGVSKQDGPQRIYVSLDRGHTWTTSDVPLALGPSAGVFSVRFQDRHTGIAVGGDFGNPTSNLGNAAYSRDGGLTWQDAAVHPAGYRSGSVWLPHDHDVAVAVGPSGSDVSADAGRTWAGFDTGSFDAVECASDGACWASGEKGRVARLVLAHR